MQKKRESIMSYGIILSLAAASALSAACILTTSSDAFARGGARVGVHMEALPATESIAELMQTVEFIAERRWALAPLQ